jgi:hypothetical protein
MGGNKEDDEEPLGDGLDGEAPNALEAEGDPVRKIIDEGELVFSYEWDSGGPGAGACTDEIYELNNQYAISSWDPGDAGPFATLDEALQEYDLLLVTSATISIDCPVMSDEDLARILVCDEDELKVQINGENWEYYARIREFKHRQ